jgi:hypothetical protein
VRLSFLALMAERVLPHAGCPRFESLRPLMLSITYGHPTRRIEWHRYEKWVGRWGEPCWAHARVPDQLSHSRPKINSLGSLDHSRF